MKHRDLLFHASALGLLAFAPAPLASQTSIATPQDRIAPVDSGRIIEAPGGCVTGDEEMAKRIPGGSMPNRRTPDVPSARIPNPCRTAGESTLHVPSEAVRITPIPLPEKGSVAIPPPAR